jgi:hypothetical protein
MSVNPVLKGSFAVFFIAWPPLARTVFRFLFRWSLVFPAPSINDATDAPVTPKALVFRMRICSSFASWQQPKSQRHKTTFIFARLLTELQRIRPSRSGCNRTPSWAGSLSLRGELRTSGLADKTTRQCCVGAQRLDRCSLLATVLGWLKFAKPISLPNGSTVCATFEQGRAFKQELNDSLGEIPERLRPLAKAFQSCGLITVPVIGFILSSEAGNWSSFWLAGTSVLKPATLRPPCASRVVFRSLP